MSSAGWVHADVVNSADAVLFCRDDCTFCDRAKQLVASEGIHHRIIDVTRLLAEDPAFEAYYNIVRNTTQARTVPIIFRRGVYVGGFDDLRALILFAGDDDF